MPPKQIALHVELIINLRKAGVRGHIVDWSVGLDRELLILTTKDVFKPRETFPDGFSTYREFSKKMNRYTCWLLRDRKVTSISLPATRENFRTLRRLNDRELLLVRGRFRTNKPLDGAVINSKGKEVRRIKIGDAAQHIFVCPNRSIWIGFSDEGFANPRSRGGGIVRINGNGRKLSSHQIMDCYAMTMNSDGSVHACTYTDFPLVHIAANGRVEELGTSPLDGIDTLVARNNTLLIDGGYEDHNKLFISRIGGRKVAPAKLKGTLRPRSLRNRFAINSKLYILEDDNVFAIAVPDLY